VLNGFAAKPDITEKIHGKVQELARLVEAHELTFSMSAAADANMTKGGGRKQAPSDRLRSLVRKAMVAIKEQYSKDHPTRITRTMFCNNGVVPGDWWHFTVQNGACLCGGSCHGLRKELHWPENIPLMDYSSQGVSARSCLAQRVIEFATCSVGFNADLIE
jgi:hypothetical protein